MSYILHEGIRPGQSLPSGPRSELERKTRVRRLQEFAALLMHILSHVDLFSAVRSFVLAHGYYSSYQNVLKFIINDRGTEVLRFLNEFLTTPRDWSHVNPEGASAAFVIAAGFPPQFPSDLDISPIIAHIGRNQSRYNRREVSDASIAYLVECNISALSERTGVHEFLQHCVVPVFRDKDGVLYYNSEETRHSARTLLDQHQALFVALPPSRYSAFITDPELVDWFLDQTPSANALDAAQFYNPPNVASSSDPDNPPETHLIPTDTITILAAGIPLPSEDHDLIDMSMPPEPGT
ncbi:hypothetical protein SISSUDRAFT_1067007 [Sistotremastrum suecicum HHB10207 ss-3]|uniref:Uncharacterized protein n=1 Tax=Sistotremastrum suecicum HHB10207 ss-3 TaxID=1314776 RepID=A0A165XMC2_9AGAM|nr:hypothetical protein SISSUDRAFT_1067007 [Sistotremastrum suecicum HHB10207 ss-3]